MKIKPLHPDFQLPVKATEGSGAYDLFMPEAGKYYGEDKVIVPLGFAAAVPEGHVALLVPRSGTGFKYGLELNNTVGVIDSDFRGEWMAAMRTKTDTPLLWGKGDRLLQMLIVPVASVDLQEVDTLPETNRGKGGMGSTGK